MVSHLLIRTTSHFSPHSNWLNTTNESGGMRVVELTNQHEQNPTQEMW